MKNTDGKKKIWDCQMVLGSFLFLSAALLQAGARFVSGFGEWYATNIYPVLVAVVGRLFGFFPFSVSEIGIYILIAWGIIQGARNRRDWHQLVRTSWLVLSFIFLIFTVNCGINYYRYPFSVYSGLEITSHTCEELEDLVDWLTRRVNETSQLRWDGEGDGGTSRHPGFEGVKAMNNLGQTYPQLGGFYPKAKLVLVSRILTVQQIAGIYSPFTIEANYNWEVTDYNIPHTICHELSHLKGFMREDEANFIGYLACIGSDDIMFQYSGYLCGWIYAANALYQEDEEAYFGYLEKLEESVREDLYKNSIFWNRFDSRISQVSNHMNDAYLKINSQKDGVKSYGRVVDLMIAHHQRSK